MKKDFNFFLNQLKTENPQFIFYDTREGLNKNLYFFKMSYIIGEIIKSYIDFFEKKVSFEELVNIGPIPGSIEILTEDFAKPTPVLVYGSYIKSKIVSELAYNSFIKNVNQLNVGYFANTIENEFEFLTKKKNTIYVFDSEQNRFHVLPVVKDFMPGIEKIITSFSQKNRFELDPYESESVFKIAEKLSYH